MIARTTTISKSLIVGAYSDFGGCAGADADMVESWIMKVESIKKDLRRPLRIETYWRDEKLVPGGAGGI